MYIHLLKKFHAADVKPLLKLSFPLIFSGVIESSVGFFSTLFLSRLGQDDLAAGALVAWVFATMMVILWGALTAVSVIVSQKHGAKDNKAVAHVLRDGLVLGLILVVPAFVLLWNLSPIFIFLGQTPRIAVLADSYLHGLAWGLLPDFVGLVLLQFLIGLGHTRMSMFFTVYWVPLNIFFNYTLMFGKFGFPALGIAGIGWGISISYWIATLTLICVMLLRKKYRPYVQDAIQFTKPYFKRELLFIGIPMGLMYCIEVGFFLILTVMMGWISIQALAANQIVLQYLSLLIAVIFSIAQGVTVRMGHQLGEHNIDGAKRTSIAGIYIATVFMAIIGFIYVFLPNILISVDFDLYDPKNFNVVQQARHFLAICAVFQFLEAVRIILFGALRGLKDTHFTLLTSIISFWCIALPLGYLFAFKLDMNGIGLWWGMVIGAITSVSLLVLRYRSKTDRYERMMRQNNGIN